MSLLDTQVYTGTLVIETCCTCQMKFGMDRQFNNLRLNDHDMFYCPAGHPQHYTGKTESQKLKDQLALKQRDLDWMGHKNERLHSDLLSQKYKTRAEKAAKARILNRIKNGVCPCCQRTFKNLADHFKSIHPDQLDKFPEIASIQIKISRKANG